MHSIMYSLSCLHYSNGVLNDLYASCDLLFSISPPTFSSHFIYFINKLIHVLRQKNDRLIY